MVFLGIAISTNLAASWKAWQVLSDSSMRSSVHSNVTFGSSEEKYTDREMKNSLGARTTLEKYSPF